MKRNSLNFTVDLAAFLILLAVVFTGFVMEYVLPPGSGGGGRGLGQGRNAREIKQLWSMTRHEWGDIHFLLAIIFVILMAVHIALHWGWIKCYLTRPKTAPSDCENKTENN